MSADKTRSAKQDSSRTSQGSRLKGGAADVTPEPKVTRLVIEGRPFPFARPQFNNRKRRVYNDAAYKAELHRIKLLALCVQRGTRRDPVRLEIAFYFRVPKSRPQADGDPYTATPDIDNLAKTVLDGLQRAWYRDDRQVYALAAVKRYGEPERTEVTAFWGAV